MDVSKNNLEQAIAALRLSRGSHPACCNLEADVDALIAALDAARGQAVAWRVWRGDSYELFFNEDAAKRRCQCFVQQRSPEPLYAAPTAAACDCDWPLLGNCESCAPPAAAVPAANVTPMRQQRTDLARLVRSINAAVYENGDGLSVTEAIGALELAKLELLKEQEQ